MNNSVEHTSLGTNDPINVMNDQKEIPKMINHFLGYLSPRYPNKGANNI